MEPPVSAYVQRADGNAVQVSLLDETPRAAPLAGPFLRIAWQRPGRFEITRR